MSHNKKIDITEIIILPYVKRITDRIGRTQRTAESVNSACLPTRIKVFRDIW